MNKIFFRLSLLFLIVGIGFTSCSKENIEKQDSEDVNSVQQYRKVDSSKLDLSEFISKVKEYNVSEEFDAMTFYTGYAISLISENDDTFQANLLKINADGPKTINQLLTASPKFKERINSKIFELILEHNLYPNWIQINGFSKDANFDFIGYFSRIIDRTQKGAKLVLYSPDEISKKLTSQFKIGVDISLTNKSLGLVFDGEPSLVSLETAENFQYNFIFIGIYDSSQISIGRTLQWDNVNLKKWYHWGKIRRANFNFCNEMIPCSLAYEWRTKYRWYTLGWTLAKRGTLDNDGDDDTFYYDDYRINLSYYYENVSFFTFQKHFEWDNWEGL